MTLHRFTPEHRGISNERVALDTYPRIARQMYKSHRAAGMRPFLARLCVIGLYCGEA